MKINKFLLCLAFIIVWMFSVSHFKYVTAFDYLVGFIIAGVFMYREIVKKEKSKRY
jgi:hypothetical protein